MSAPNLPSIFRNVRNRPRGFNYIPRYYDERKEKLEKRIRIIEKEHNAEQRDVEIAKARMQSKLRHKFDSTSNHYVDHARTLRLAIILGILIAISISLYSYLDL